MGSDEEEDITAEGTIDSRFGTPLVGVEAVIGEGGPDNSSRARGFVMVKGGELDVGETTTAGVAEAVDDGGSSRHAEVTGWHKVVERPREGGKSSAKSLSEESVSSGMVGS